MTDHLGHRIKEANDVEQHGVKGMKWGVRNDGSTGSASAGKAAGGGGATKHVEKASGGSGSSGPPKPTGPETHAERFNRLESHVKAGKGKELDNEDLKFFNARAEALSKIDKYNKEQPDWLARTAKRVVQTSAQKALQTVTDIAVDKYVTGPLKAVVAPKSTS